MGKEEEGRERGPEMRKEASPFAGFDRSVGLLDAPPLDLRNSSALQR